MTPETLSAFSDELSKIADSTFSKKAGVVADIGTRITKAVVPKVTQAWKSSQGLRNNVTGSVKAFADPRQSWNRGVAHLKKEWSGDGQKTLGSKVNKALMVGGTALGVAEVAPKDDPTGRGRSRLQRAAGFVGNQAANVLTAPFGISGGIVGGVIGQTAGELVGSGIDKARGYKKPAKKKSPTASTPTVAGPRSVGSEVAQKVIG